MPRPRLVYNDCVVAVFRTITGEDDETALGRFLAHAKGQAGFSRSALAACLADAGWLMNEWDADTKRAFFPSDGLFSKAAKALWREFQGQAVIFYNADGAQMYHTILVCPGGVVLDPSPEAPENGEFIVDHFQRVVGKIGIASVSTVTPKK